MPTPKRSSARERLLQAASELFYTEDVSSVGIDRVIERAGVAKASLYDCFGSKEELVRSYLQARFEARKALLGEKLAKLGSPREKILAVFEVLAELTAQPGYRMCPFVRAGSEADAGPSIKQICAESRAWTRALFTGLAREAGLSEPERLGQQLLMLYDGASVSSDVDRNIEAAIAARAMAAMALDSKT